METYGSFPFFPLGIVAFPNENVRLHIFEPRYKQMFNELEKDNGHFVIIPHLEGRVRAVGTLLSFEKIHKRYDSGELDVSAIGVCPVEIKSFQQKMKDKLYAGGEVNRMTVSLNPLNYKRSELLLERCNFLMRSLGARFTLPPFDVEGLSYALAHRVGLDDQKKYRLLTIESEEDRQEFLLKYIEASIKDAERVKEIKRQVQMNGHFRYIQSKEF